MAATTILVAWVGGAWLAPAARAQPALATQPAAPTEPALPNPDPTTTGPATTKAPPTTAGRISTTTTAPRSTTTAASTTTTTVPIPEWMIAVANSVRRTPPNNTAALLSVLAPLQKLGYTAEQAAIVGMGQFPVAGPAYYTDDWLELRPGPPPALHPGIDIDAAMGTPLRSPVDGVLTYDTSDPTGYGLDAIVTAPDKTFYRMAHMSATVSGLSTGSVVKSGQVIGFVGSSGNSTGPHCHFEIHPQGGAGIDAKPILDQWLANAIKAAPALILSLQPSPSSTAPSPPTIPAAIPAPASLFPSIPLLPLPVAHRAAPPPSLVGLALMGLLALVVSSTLTAWRLRSGGRRIAVYAP
jgi:murein DD-endopeptidase MepM/ murein hydrolase activator NlpD